jgi:prepilin-type N-terminal cleavage/methylation domain-containing protein
MVHALPIRGVAAFTLIELLVAMSILSMIIVLLMSIVDNTTKLWQGSENRVDGFREARAALNVIAADLRAAYISADPRQFRLNLKDGLPHTAITAPDAGSIFFLTSQSADSQDATPPEGSHEPGNKSNLCAVGYFQGFDAATFHARQSMNLYRYLSGSTATFEKLRKEDPLFNDIETGPAGAEVLARNITSFKVRAFAIDPSTGKPAEIPANQSTIPDYIDIELTAINNDVARRIDESKSAWQSKDSPAYKQNARTFTMRVSLPPAHPTPTPEPPPGS